MPIFCVLSSLDITSDDVNLVIRFSNSYSWNSPCTTSMARVPMPSRCRYGWHSLKTCLWWSCKREWKRSWSLSGMTSFRTMSAATRSLKRWKGTCWPYLKMKNTFPRNSHFLTNGLPFWKTNPQCLFIGTADTWFFAFQLLADSNIMI